MFGSRARGDNMPNSDLDLFIDYQESKKLPSLLDIIEFELDFLELTGIPAHITTRDSLHPAVVKSVERDALKIF